MRFQLFLLCCLLPIAACTQSYKSRIHYSVRLGDTTQLHQLILLDYSKLLGLAERIEKDTLYFRPRSASTTSAVPVGKMRFLGEYIPPGKTRRRRANGSPGFTDMTYERTALPFHSKGQLRVVQLIYVVSEFNLNENIQVGAGLAGPLGILTTQRLRASLTPDLHVGLSNQLLFLPLIFTFDDRQPIVGDVTGIVTLGNDERFLNLGTGFFYNTDTQDETIWLHRAGVGGKISDKWHLYAEAVTSLNTRFDDLELYPSFNASYGSGRHRWRFGLATIFRSLENFFPPPLPYVGYSLYW